ncbi:helicase HerA-like domain-containing protein [Salinibacterium amurskyense]|uniref:helicase HerA-like domain-containing protein n=1 Tax=Salinibacterium amurskyense TaxID=205941 RepID=UPI00311E6917
MTDAAAQVEAAKKALAEAQAALAAAELASAEAALAAEQAAEQAAAAADSEAAAESEPAAETSANSEATTSKPKAAPVSAPTGALTETGDGPLSADEVAAVRDGYAFEGEVLEMGALVNGDALAGVPVRIPVAMLNRHGLVAGATGTGKTKTLQVLAEQLSAAGVPVFAADIKGDLSGIATAGTSSEKLLERTDSIGQDWQPAASPTEYFTLGGMGTGVPIRATVSSFGPLLLSKVLGLNDTQESSLGLIFHYADQAGLPLVDLSDLRAVVQWLLSDEGKAELKNLGGLSSATAGVILRELIGFANEGADDFFGEPEIDTSLFLRTNADGAGIVSLLEIPGVSDKPALFSTFLMWLLADLFNDLPEVGDIDKPKLVFFFDEAHLLFKDASKDFIASITQTVRLIRSKGVGVVFVTQTPKDVPSDVLAQIGSRFQHQLRAHTPDSAKALKATVSTYPTSGYDLGEVLTTLATGEAIITVMNEKGAPTPVAWTRLRAPQGSMSPTDAAVMAAAVEASPLMATYGAAVDRESAREILAVKMNAAAEADAAAEAAEAAEDAAKEAEKLAKAKAKEQAKVQAEYERALKDMNKKSSSSSSSRTTTRTSTRKDTNVLGDVLGSRTGQTVVREVLRGIFSTLKRR